MTVCLQGAKVIDPANGVNKVTNVYIDDGKILKVGKQAPSTKISTTYDLSGFLVMPGLVDLGAHLREPGHEHKGSITSELKAAVAGGFTTLCCTPDTQPAIDNASVVDYIKQRANRERSAKVHCLGALTANLEGKILAEMYALKESGCIAVTNLQQRISDTSVLRHALAYAASCQLKVFLHPYEHWLSSEGKMHEGKVSTRYGIPGIPHAAELIAIQRDLLLVEETGVEAHFCRLSCGAAVQMVAQAKRRKLPITADVAISNLLFDENNVQDYDGSFHVDPPLRAKRDRTQLLNGIKGRQIDAVTTHHEPHDLDAKLAPFSLTEPGISTLDSYCSSVLDLVSEGRIDIEVAVAAASTNPAKILGLDAGTLSVGANADVCVVDPKREWILDDESMLSLGKNSPLVGKAMRGKVVLTLINGRIVFDGRD